MRIVQKSNYDLDWYDESFILWPMQQDTCQKIADALNEDGGTNSPHYYKVVDNDYELYIGMVS